MCVNNPRAVAPPAEAVRQSADVPMA